MAKSTSFHITGKLEHHELEGGFWGITDEQGRQWLPVNLENPAAGNFRFELEKIEGAALIFMWGTAVKVLKMDKIPA